ncbi:MAG: hypothetical protein GX986_00690 [Firmicutes bacterium]|nr:hypothetical protein [Bacillota bacterium]
MFRQLESALVCKGESCSAIDTEYWTSAILVNDLWSILDDDVGLPQVSLLA